MAGFFDGAVYAQITDSPVLTLDASAGWTFSFFVYPDTSISEPGFGYIYSHGIALAINDAVNIIRGGIGSQPYNTVRIIIDWVGGSKLVDFTSTNTLNNNEWNSVGITYISGGSLYITINGSSDSTLPPALPDINPTGEARIGYSVAGGTRNFPGRIAHAAKWDRNFPVSELEAFTSTYLSPEFAQNSLIWHVPMFTNATWDEQGAITVTPQGMAWDRHGPFVYPAKSFKGRGSGGILPTTGEDTWRNFRTA